MAADEGTSCQLCLNADEASSMVAVELPHHLVQGAPPVLLCRWCVASIAVASRKELEAEAADLDDEDEKSPG